MSLKAYIITAKTLSGCLVYKYDLDGVLRIFENKAELNAEQMQWFASRLPTLVDMVQIMVQQSGGKLKVEELPLDLSFEMFWDAYANKKGSKAEAEKYWEGIKVTDNKRPVTEADRIAIIKCLNKMKYNYQLRKIEMPYPTTFLHQRRWENEF